MQTEVAHPTDDPIFAAIEAHRQASHDYQIAIDREALEPKKRIFPDDAFEAFGDRESEAYLALRKTMPTTMAGLVAYFQYLRAPRDMHLRSDSVFEHMVWENGNSEDLMRWVRLMEVAVRRIAAAPQHVAASG
jgi:hypothetical protein